jgi:hypothetical protein
MLAPEDPRWISGDFIEKLLEVAGSRKRLISVPAQITVLAVQSPQSLCGYVPELGHRHLMPLLRPLKPWSLFEQDDFVSPHSKAETQFVTDGGPAACLAECGETPVDLCPLELRQRHARSP